jgi:hypothetical protein
VQALCGVLLHSTHELNDCGWRLVPSLLDAGVHFFFRLEHLHFLDRKDPNHLWLLHHLFLDNINNGCKEFQGNWNSKPISGEGHDQSPNVSLFLHPVYGFPANFSYNA